MKRKAPDHPKMKALARRMKVALCTINGIMERLWHHCGDYTPDGGIGKLTDLEIAEACAIPTDMDARDLVLGMIETGWLDPMENCRLFVHDWSDHCEDSINRKIAKDHLFFADGSPPKLSKLPWKERESLIDFYGIAPKTATNEGDSNPFLQKQQNGETGNDSGEIKSEKGKRPQDGEKSGTLGEINGTLGALPTPSPLPLPLPLPTPPPSRAKNGHKPLNGGGGVSLPVFPRSAEMVREYVEDASDKEIARLIESCQVAYAAEKLPVMPELKDDAIAQAIRESAFRGQYSVQPFMKRVPQRIKTWTRKAKREFQ